MIEEKSLLKDGNAMWKVSTAPAIEPVTLEELKIFARIDTEEEDSLLFDFITSARQLMENYLGKALIQQTITLKMDFWPGDVIELPRPPLISITAIETLDEDDTATTYSADNYYTITESIPGQVVMKQSVTYPTNTTRDYGGFQIRYLAGYGDSATDVPQAIRKGIEMLATEMYEGRIIPNELPNNIKTLVNMYRVLRI